MILNGSILLLLPSVQILVTAYAEDEHKHTYILEAVYDLSFN